LAGRHVRGYKENGTTTTPFDMVVLNDIDRFHLASDVIDRVHRLESRAAYAKQHLRDQLMNHKQYICKYGEDLRISRRSSIGSGIKLQRKINSEPVRSRVTAADRTYGACLELLPTDAIAVLSRSLAPAVAQSWMNSELLSQVLSG
jgi:hypothetical protein